MSGWIDIKNKQPKDGQRVMGAELHKYSNGHWEYSIALGIYEAKEKTIDYNPSSEGTSRLYIDKWFPVFPPELTSQEKIKSKKLEDKERDERISRHLKEIKKLKTINELSFILEQIFGEEVERGE